MPINVVGPGAARQASLTGGLSGSRTGMGASMRPNPYNLGEYAAWASRQRAAARQPQASDPMPNPYNATEYAAWAARHSDRAPMPNPYKPLDYAAWAMNNGRQATPGASQGVGQGGGQRGQVGRAPYGAAPAVQGQTFAPRGVTSYGLFAGAPAGQAPRLPPAAAPFVGPPSPGTPYAGAPSVSPPSGFVGPPAPAVRGRPTLNLGHPPAPAPVMQPPSVQMGGVQQSGMTTLNPTIRQDLVDSRMASGDNTGGVKRGMASTIPGTAVEVAGAINNPLGYAGEKILPGPNPYTDAVSNAAGVADDLTQGAAAGYNDPSKPANDLASMTGEELARLFSSFTNAWDKERGGKEWSIYEAMRDLLPGFEQNSLVGDVGANWASAMDPAAWEQMAANRLASMGEENLGALNLAQRRMNASAARTGLANTGGISGQLFNDYAGRQQQAQRDVFNDTLGQQMNALSGASNFALGLSGQDQQRWSQMANMLSGGLTSDWNAYREDNPSGASALRDLLGAAGGAAGQYFDTTGKLTAAGIEAIGKLLGSFNPATAAMAAGGA